jgi:hypothetical protein
LSFSGDDGLVSTYNYESAWLEPHPSKPRSFILHVEINSEAVAALREIAKRNFPGYAPPDPATMAGIMFMNLRRPLEDWASAPPEPDPRP